MARKQRRKTKLDKLCAVARLLVSGGEETMERVKANRQLLKRVRDNVGAGATVEEEEGVEGMEGDP